MNKKMINIVCWSVGQHAINNMLPAITECKETYLIGIFTRNEDVASEQSRLYQCLKYNSENDFLSDDSVDAVYISSPTSVHSEQILKCLNAGKSVIVEKTALPTLPETDYLVKKANQNNLVIMEAFMYRFHNQFKTLQRIVDSKKYGEIIKIDCEFGFPHLDANNIRYKRNLSGGALYDAGAYTLSAARNLLGNKCEVIWSNMIQLKHYEVDTRGAAVLLADNIIANCSWVFGASYSNRIKVWCEFGHIICDRAFSKKPDYNSSIIVENNGIVIDEIITGCDNHFINMLTSFYEQVVSKQSKTENSETMEQASIVEKIRNFPVSKC